MNFFGRKKPAEFEDPSLAEDLTKLQINTILKSNISGGTMPALRFALCDISARYGMRLCQLGADSGELDKYIKEGGFRSFDKYQQVAKRMQIELQEIEADEVREFYMLQRIRSNSNRIKTFLEDAPDKNEYTKVQLYESMKGEMTDFQPARGDYMMIHKYWELGTEQIMMQTVVQLDGDVYTRILDEYATEEFKSLHEIHHSGVNLSYRYWQNIIKIVSEFLTTVFAHMLPSKK
jgi:hypothetical protein